MRFIKRNGGQFVPISAMVMFTMVIFMVAIVNVYRVARTKLKVQNLADAAALSLASQQGQAFNIVADRNEWMNHMVAGAETPTYGPKVRDPNNPCAGVDPLYQLGISCVDNNKYALSEAEMKRRHIFNSKEGAVNYAGLVKSINDAQKLFVQAYNSFLGASNRAASSSVSSGSDNLVGLLRKDIPELKDDPTISLIVWNTRSGEASAESKAKNYLANPDSIQKGQEGAVVDSSQMSPLSFAVKDVYETHWKKRCGQVFPGVPFCMPNTDTESGTLASKYYNQAEYPADMRIGYMVPCTAERAKSIGCLGPEPMPEISVPGKGGNKSRTGVGVYVVKKISLPILGSYAVGAKAKAYIVEGSGVSGRKNDNDIREVARFQPTYWVKLAN